MSISLEEALQRIAEEFEDKGELCEEVKTSKHKLEISVRKRMSYGVPKFDHNLLPARTVEEEPMQTGPQEGSFLDRLNKSLYFLGQQAIDSADGRYAQTATVDGVNVCISATVESTVLTGRIHSDGMMEFNAVVPGHVMEDGLDEDSEDPHIDGSEHNLMASSSGGGVAVCPNCGEEL